jgi:hypothetical protein
VSSIDDYRARLIELDPQITSYFQAANLDSLPGLLVAARKSRQWAEGDKALDAAALDQLIMDMDASVAAPTVKISPVAEATELYYHDRGRPTPQKVEMHLDIESGTLSCAYVPRGDEESIPKSVYHHRGVLWAIPCLTMDAANKLMAEATPACQRIIAGTEIDWDGNNNVGTYDQDAQAAIDEIATLIERYDEVDYILTEYSGDEYYDDGPDAARQALGISSTTSDDDLARIVAQAAAEALDNRVMIPDLQDYLTDLREESRNQEREELEEIATQLADLTARRDALICRQLGWGDTTRDVGLRAGMTHAGVQKVRRRAAS